MGTPGPGTPAIHTARNKAFIKDWNAGATEESLAEKYGLGNRKGALNLASLLRRNGHKIKKRHYRVRASATRSARGLVHANVAPAIIMNAAGKVVGEMNPITRVKTFF